MKGANRDAEPPIVCDMAKTNDIKESFSALLRDSLRAQYGRIPSAAVVAREFNLRAYDTSPVSQESARRWLRGVSLPEEERLRVLVNWLNLDFNAALKRQSPRFHGARATPPHQEEIDRPSPSEPRSNPVQPSDRPSNGFAREEDELIRLILELDDLQRHALLDLVRIGFRTPANS